MFLAEIPAMRDCLMVFCLKESSGKNNILANDTRFLQEKAIWGEIP